MKDLLGRYIKKLRNIREIKTSDLEIDKGLISRIENGKSFPSKKIDEYLIETFRLNHEEEIKYYIYKHLSKGRIPPKVFNSYVLFHTIKALCLEAYKEQGKI